jgi:hypothetical protein
MLCKHESINFISNLNKTDIQYKYGFKSKYICKSCGFIIYKEEVNSMARYSVLDKKKYLNNLINRFLKSGEKKEKQVSQNLIKKENTNMWNNIKESKKPKDHEYVLLSNGKKVQVGYYSKLSDEFRNVLGETIKNISHWRNANTIDLPSNEKVLVESKTTLKSDKEVKKTKEVKNEKPKTKSNKKTK